MGQESIRRVLTIALLTLPLSFACKIEEGRPSHWHRGFHIGKGRCCMVPTTPMESASYVFGAKTQNQWNQ